MTLPNFYDKTNCASIAATLLDLTLAALACARFAPDAPPPAALALTAASLPQDVNDCAPPPLDPIIRIANTPPPRPFEDVYTTKLHYAAGHNRATLVQWLIYTGADLNPKNIYCDTPLDVAVDAEYAEIVRILIAAGADASGNNALSGAVHKENVEIVRILIAAGANVNPCNECHTPLHLAALSHNPELVPLLLDAGASVNATADNAVTPLHYAVSKNAWNVKLETIQALIDAGADVHAKFARRFTPLDSAMFQAVPVNLDGDDKDFSSQKFTAIARILVDAGADIERSFSKGNTALHLAIKHEHPSRLAQMLIDAGANLNTKNNAGQTPLHIAADLGITDVAAVLVAAGADIHAADMNGNTPADIAADRGYDDIADLLR